MAMFTPFAFMAVAGHFVLASSLVAHNGILSLGYLSSVIGCIGIGFVYAKG